MPIVNTYLGPGDPTIQASGEYRGRINFEFTGGRIISRNIRAPDADTWAALLLSLDGAVELQQQQNDAEQGVDPDAVIVAGGEASIEQRAVAYLRAAWRSEDPYAAFLLFERFNNFRLAKGWSVGDVFVGLSGAGLEQEEWDEMNTAYQYLAGASRPAAMSAYQTIKANWDGR